ncbi:MAG: hypothetical protein PQJ49_12010 [Sphaerochaetaceae bacterium]|nr:hypothetical protein [Sphaerochaetaceae bacterium]
MNIQKLNGIWNCYPINAKTNIKNLKAKIPGSIYEALIDNKIIEDPYYSDNEQKQMWIGKTDWVFERSFTLDSNFIEESKISLICEGLDTLCDVYLNNTLIGVCDNQFRRWEFDVSPYLDKKENKLKLIFKQTYDYMKSNQDKRYLNATGVGQHRIDGSNRIRKSQCNYGWDWGPMCVTCGIVGSIYLEKVNTPKIIINKINQEHREDYVKLNIGYKVSNHNLLKESFVIQTDIILNDKIISRKQNNFDTDTIEFEIKNPKLWWTHDLGSQSLYTVSISIINEKNKALSFDSRRIGLRKVELQQKVDRWGKSFTFYLNDIPIFIKGANWIPADTFPTRLDKKDYLYLVDSCVDVNMNMIRVWGGGIYEKDCLYDFCDEKGILIWQDLMFACSAYPSFDQAWVENVSIEISDQVSRLFHHPSIALWCGNNEIEQINEELIGNTFGKMTWNEYCQLFDNIIPSLITRIDTDRAYWPSSPHTPDGNRLEANNPKSGDAHLWEVWHGRKPFEWYRESEHRFVSEFGFQSFPQPSVLKDFLKPNERNINSYAMDLHQRSPIGNDAIIQYMLSWFQLPHNITMTFWLSQILQGLAMKYAIDHWRRSKPRCMGTLYWQLNDCWPAASWSSIDWKGNWKALHYFAKRFYNPISITAVESKEENSCSIWVVNDNLEQIKADIVCNLMNANGDIIWSKSTQNYQIDSLSSTMVEKICFDFDFDYKNTFFNVTLLEKNIPISSDTIFFERPKYFELQKPNIKWKLFPMESDNLKTIMEIKCEKPAFWVWLDIPDLLNKFSDNFFHLFPNDSKKVIICEKLEALSKLDIQIHSLYSCRNEEIEI